MNEVWTEPMRARRPWWLAGGVLLLLLATIGAAALSRQQAQLAVQDFLKGDGRLVELSLHSNTALAKARRYEKEFLLKWRELGYDEARARYISQMRLQLADVRADVAAIRRLGETAAISEATQGVAAAVDRYESGFLSVSQLYGRLGQVDTGLEGQLRERTQALEGRVRERGSARLLVELLMLRRAEQDYLLHHQGRDSDAFEQGVANFRRELTQSARPASDRRQLAAALDEYHGLFRHYQATLDEIETASQDYRRAANTLEPILAELYLQAGRSAPATEALQRRLNQSLIWAALAASLATAGLGLLARQRHRDRA